MLAIFTGLAAGSVHVWSGPDHLAAIAPLAVRRTHRAWAPGLRWGLGHSAGVGLVGLLSLWLRDLLPVNLLSTWGERTVGVMLFGIGLWALRKAFRIHAHEHEHDGEREGVSRSDGWLCGERDDGGRFLAGPLSNPNLVRDDFSTLSMLSSCLLFPVSCFCLPNAPGGLHFLSWQRAKGLRGSIPT